MRIGRLRIGVMHAARIGTLLNMSNKSSSFDGFTKMRQKVSRRRVTSPHIGDTFGLHDVLEMVRCYVYEILIRSQKE